MSWINTWSGKTLDYAEPKPESICIEDIATALSRECRYAGHSQHFYSVAQHSVLVSRIVPPEHALEGLLHDAQEAYLKDIPSPLKTLLPDYRRLEARFDALIRQRFELPSTPSREIKQADLTALATEKRDLFPPAVGDWPILEGIAPSKARITPAPPDLARMMFLHRYQLLRIKGGK